MLACVVESRQPNFKRIKDLWVVHLVVLALSQLSSNLGHRHTRTKGHAVRGSSRQFQGRVRQRFNAAHLGEFVEDGLLEWSDDACRITDDGRAFLRNICMAFDARLSRKAPDTELFSRTI